MLIGVDDTRSVGTGTTVITGGLVVNENETFRADIIIRNGRVGEYNVQATIAETDNHIDATGLMVLPGVLDVHTHFREPDPNTFEGFTTGSAAAAAGGVTTVVEMPQAGPTTKNLGDFRKKIAAVGQSSTIDMALWGGIIGGDDRDEDAIRDMAKSGAVAFKSFMAASSPSFPAVDTAKLLWAMTILADFGLPYGLHAEDDASLQAGIQRMTSAGRTDAVAHAQSRPPLVETVAVRSAILLAERTGCWLYICHCASADALELIADARTRGLRITVETCPQYLAMTTNDLVRLNGFARCAPAIRDDAEVERIWDHVLHGHVDIISSDHVACSAALKEAGNSNIFDAPNGLPGVQTMLPILWDSGVKNRGLNPNRIVQMLSSNPARTFGLYPRKGSLALGSDADLVLFDSDDAWTIRGSDMLYRQKWTPFEGKRVFGRVKRTMVRGETVYLDGAPGRAEYIRHRLAGQFLHRGYGSS
ncbi:allantoinase [soil metagenome]